jgi:hypothetical protein
VNTSSPNNYQRAIAPAHRFQVISKEWGNDGLEIDPFQVVTCGPVQYPSFVIEARTMTRTIPAFLSRVPGNYAAEMCARGGERMEISVTVTIGSNLSQADALDRCLPDP